MELKDSIFKLQVDIFKNFEQAMTLITKQQLKRHITNLLREKIYSIGTQLGIKIPQYLEFQGFQDQLNQINEASRKICDDIKKLIQMNFFQDFNDKNQNINNFQTFIAFDSQLKKIQNNVNNFAQYNRMDKSSFLELDDSSLNITQDFVQTLDRLLDECSQKIKKNKATQLSKKLTNELAFIVWLSYDKMIQIESPATHEFFYSLKLIHKQLEKQDLDIIQQKKIISVIDKSNNKYISPDMINNFFNYQWVNKDDREYMLNSEEQIEEIYYQAGTLQMQCIKARQGHQLFNRKYLMDQEGLKGEIENKNGVVRVGRASNIWTNEVVIDGDLSISRKQFQIIFKGKYGYCVIDTSNSNLTGILINNFGFQLYNKAIVNVGNFSNIYLEVVEINNGSFDTQNQIIDQSQIVQQINNKVDDEEEESKTIIFKKVRKPEKKQVQPEIKQKLQNDVIKLNEIDEDEEERGNTFVAIKPKKPQQNNNIKEESKQKQDEEESGTFVAFKQKKPNQVQNIQKEQIISNQDDEEERGKTIFFMKKKPSDKQNPQQEQQKEINDEEEEIGKTLNIPKKRPQKQQDQQIKQNQEKIENDEEEEGQTLQFSKKRKDQQIKQNQEKIENDEEEEGKTLQFSKKRKEQNQEIKQQKQDDEEQERETFLALKKKKENKQQDMDEDLHEKTITQQQLKKIKMQEQNKNQQDSNPDQTIIQNQRQQSRSDSFSSQSPLKGSSQSMAQSFIADTWVENNLYDNLQQLKVKPYIKLKIHNSFLEFTDVEYTKNVDFIDSNGEEITIGGDKNNTVFFTNNNNPLPDKLFVICYEKWQWKIKKLDQSFVSVIHLKNIQETEQKIPSKAFPIQNDMIISIGENQQEFQFKFKFLKDY